MAQRRRQDHILDMVTKSGFVTIDELVERFNVTPQTIRRDLNQLADANKIKRHHGGAGLESSTVNTAYTQRKVTESAAKEKIAEMLADFVPDGASLFINIGTTTDSVARALLKRRDLQIVTNNLHVASILAEREDFTIIIAGGEVRNRDGGIIGEATLDLISQFQMDYAVIGISGIQADGMLLDFDYREVRVAQAIIAHSREVLLCADHTKFGRNPMVRLGSISQADHLFTDRKPEPEYRQMLEEHDVCLHY